MFKKGLVTFVFFSVLNMSIFGQTHISVPLGHPVYLVIEQAQMRGLCGFLPSVKPYSKAQIVSIINKILNNDEERRFGGLTEAEKKMLEQFKNDFTVVKEGFDWIRGTLFFEETRNDVYFSGELGIGIDAVFAGSYYHIAGGYQYNEDDSDLFMGANHPGPGDFFADYTIQPSISFKGNLGRNASYGLTIIGFIGESPRAVLGRYYYDIAKYNSSGDSGDLRTVYSEPLAYFPYTYKKRWDGFLFAIGDYSSSSQIAWPEGLSVGYMMIPELAGDFFDGHFFYRFSRIDREWGGLTTNGSLVLNQSAQPFMAFETVITPFPWISFSSLTGVLEFDPAPDSGNSADLKGASETFQNAFSIVMLEASVKNILNITLGSSVVWPKRFELGYLFPFAENFMYQNNIGDFDNLALFLNAQLQYPGIGKLWLSFCLDELNIQNLDRVFEMDRMMYIYQFGTSFQVPWISFASFSMSYTKNEPYNYTHPRIKTPWNGSAYMEQNYVNFGKSLGHYIPPNSDEILIRFEMMPVSQLTTRFQYQLIRHGAEYGDRAVDGSSLYSELNGSRNTNPALRKFFLRDGAYQWMHIFKLRGEYSFTALKAPVKLFAEIGGVYSYFTDIEGEANSGNKGIYSIINTPQYPTSISFIGIIGFQLFPEF